jgi:hypothetical protein
MFLSTITYVGTMEEDKTRGERHEGGSTSHQRVASDEGKPEGRDVVTKEESVVFS